MDKPKYRYNWKTGKADLLFEVGTRIYGDQNRRQAQRKRNADTMALAVKMVSLNSPRCIITDETAEFSFDHVWGGAFNPNVVDEYQHRAAMTRIALNTPLIKR